MKVPAIPGIRWRGLAAVAVAAAVAGCGSSEVTGSAKSATHRSSSSTSTAGGSTATGSSFGSSNGYEVPLRIGVGSKGGVVVLAPVFINGHGPFPFVVDTGASKSVIDQSLARKLGFKIHSSHAALTGVNSTHAAGEITVSTWRLGAVALPAQNVLTLPLASDQRGPGLGGLIGSDNLRRFGSFLLSYRLGALILSP